MARMSNGRIELIWTSPYLMEVPDPRAPDPCASDVLIISTFKEVAKSQRLGWLETAEEDGWKWVVTRVPDVDWSYVSFRRNDPLMETSPRRILTGTFSDLQDAVQRRAILLDDDLANCAPEVEKSYTLEGMPPGASFNTAGRKVAP